MLQEQTTLLDFAARVYPAVLQHDLLRYVVGAGGTFLIVNVLLGRYLAARRIRSERPCRGQMVREILASLRTVLIFSMVGFCIALAARLGLLNVYMDPAERGWPYFAFNVAVLIVAHDAWFYWTHRLMHRPRLFRWFHRLHHRSNNPTPWASYLFDTSEAVVNAIYLPLALILMPTSVLAAFIFTAHMMLRNAIGHCGYEVSGPGGWPAIIRLADDGDPPRPASRARRHELGFYFTFWDRGSGSDPDYHVRFADAVGRHRTGQVAAQEFRRPDAQAPDNRAARRAALRVAGPDRRPGDGEGDRCRERSGP